MNPSSSLPNHEPPDGDFVAYLDRLQAESLRRHAGVHPLNAVTPASPVPTSAARHDAALPPGQPQANSAAAQFDAEQVRELMQRLGAGDLRAEQLLPGLAIGLGVLFLVVTAASGGGPVGIFVGIGLIVWGGKRLEALKKNPPRP